MFRQRLERISMTQQAGVSRQQKGSGRLTATLPTSLLKPSTMQDFKFSSALKTLVNGYLRNCGSEGLALNIRSFMSDDRTFSAYDRARINRERRRSWI